MEGPQQQAPAANCGEELIMSIQTKSFKEICTILGIPEYSTVIFNSHSRGELAFTQDYYELAERLNGRDPAVFVKCFKHYDEIARMEWQRPQSWYQHLIKGINQAAIQLGCVKELIETFKYDQSPNKT